MFKKVNKQLKQKSKLSEKDYEAFDLLAQRIKSNELRSRHEKYI